MTNGSISSKVPGSRSSAIRSRAVSLPLACCCSARASLPVPCASSFLRLRSSRRSLVFLSTAISPLQKRVIPPAHASTEGRGQQGIFRRWTLDVRLVIMTIWRPQESRETHAFGAGVSLGWRAGLLVEFRLCPRARAHNFLLPLRQR